MVCAPCVNECECVASAAEVQRVRCEVCEEIRPARACRPRRRSGPPRARAASRRIDEPSGSTREDHIDRVSAATRPAARFLRGAVARPPAEEKSVVALAVVYIGRASARGAGRGRTRPLIIIRHKGGGLGL